MNAPLHAPSLWRRVIKMAIASAGIWAVAVGAFYWYLPRMVAEEYRNGSRTNTNGDSIAIPLFSFALLFGRMLVVANAVVIANFFWRRRGNGRSTSRPAV